MVKPHIERHQRLPQAPASVRLVREIQATPAQGTRKEIPDGARGRGASPARPTNTEEKTKTKPSPTFHTCKTQEAQ